jgi:hypothetical protein
MNGASRTWANLSVPSWVIPGTYLENLRFLADKSEISGVELLFFLYDQETRALLDGEWEGILGYRSRFSFTAHLPDPLKSEHRELVERLSPVVRHFIVHPGLDAETFAGLLSSWTGAGLGPFLVENTQPGKLEALLPYLGDETKLCMDTGHLLLEGQNPAAFFRRHGARLLELHLHSLDREKAAVDGWLPDHRPIQRGEPWLEELLPLLEDWQGVLNVEVFSWEEARESIAALLTYRRSL